MIAMLSLFVPPLLLVLVREKIEKKHMGLYDKAIGYVFSVLGINWTMMMLLRYVFDSTGPLFSKLNTYDSFACKYILCATTIAAIVPYLEHFLRNRLKIHLSFPKGPMGAICSDMCSRYFKICGIIYASILFFLNVIRIFDDNFWFDEAVTLSRMRGTFSSIAAWAASDVHPPLYYYMLKTVYMVFGNHGWAHHLLSLLPCLVIFVLSLTIFWKEFGGKVSFILITFAGLSENAIKYNMEVRMYSWAGLFVLLSYYGLWRILKRQKEWDYVFFAAVSLGAAYTHYFAMVTVAFFYLVLMFLAVFSKRLDIKRVLMIWSVTIAGYIPWAVVFFKTVLRAADAYWIRSTPTLKAAISCLFSESFSKGIVWMALIAAAILFFLYETRIVTMTFDRRGGCCVDISLGQMMPSDMAIWIASGIFCVMGTILFAVVYSYLTRPVFNLRYIYPASNIAWIVLAVIVSRIRAGKLWIAILWIYLLNGFIPGYQSIYMNEKKDNNMLQATLDATRDMDISDVVLVDNTHLAGVAVYHYPDIEVRKFDLGGFPNLDSDVCYYLFLSDGEKLTRALEEVDRQGFNHTQIMDAGYMGDDQIAIYRIESR